MILECQIPPFGMKIENSTDAAIVMLECFGCSSLSSPDPHMAHRLGRESHSGLPGFASRPTRDVVEFKANKGEQQEPSPQVEPAKEFNVAGYTIIYARNSSTPTVNIIKHLREGRIEIAHDKFLPALRGEALQKRCLCRMRTVKWAVPKMRGMTAEEVGYHAQRAQLLEERIRDFQNLAGLLHRRKTQEKLRAFLGPKGYDAVLSTLSNMAHELTRFADDKARSRVVHAEGLITHPGRLSLRLFYTVQRFRDSLYQILRY